MDTPYWQTELGDGPTVATAIHNGDLMRAELLPLFGLDDTARMREEDPYTGAWTSIAPTRIVVTHSRFEVDLNRPRDKAVYRTPADAWGLDVWRMPPEVELLDRSLAFYDEFYAHVRQVLEGLVARHGRVVVFDIHSYNHRRDGANGPPADPENNPEINLGTGSMRRDRWAPVVDRFLNELREFDCLGRRLDARENVKFFGGNLAAWIHQNFPESVCVLAVEVKKFFMHEWTGTLIEAEHDAVGRALRQAASGVEQALDQC